MPSANVNMKIDADGRQFIKNVEEPGGKARLKAYDDGTGTPTIAWGCTEGVHFGMKITLAQAEAMFDAEIAEVEAGMRRVIKRPISQGLCNGSGAFFYNNGFGKCPTLIKAINAGDDTKIRAAFMLYTKARKEGDDHLTTWDGLVARRAAELQHWAEVDAKHKGSDITEWAPAVEPAKPSITGTAVRSKTFWMQINATWMVVVGWFTDWGKTAVDKASTLIGATPDIIDSTQTTLSTVDQVSGWLKVNLSEMTVLIVVACLVLGAIRHVRDKREIAT